MNFQDVVRRRRMVRAYQPGRAVPPQLREQILDNATRAPSAGFTQGWAFLVLEDALDRDRFWAVTATAQAPDSWLRRMRQAPLLVVCFADQQAYQQRYAEDDKTAARARPWAVPYWHVDTGMAALLMLQSAVDLGLGACFFGVPAERVDQLKQEFGVPQHLEPTGVVSIGYPDPDADRRSGSLRRGRKPRDEVVHMGQWHTDDAKD